MYPDKDLTCQLIHKVPWNAIADKIKHYHGKFLAEFYKHRLKVRDENRRVVFKIPRKHPPPEVRSPAFVVVSVGRIISSGKIRRIICDL